MKKVKKSNVLLTCGLMFFGAGLAVGSAAGIQNNQHYKAANADDPVSYIYRSWDETNKVVVDEERTCSTYTVLASSSSEINLTDGGWYVVNSNIKVTKTRVVVTGTVNLIICDGCLMEIAGQIGVDEGNTLNIYGQSEDSGRIVANNNFNAAWGNGYANGAGIGGYNHPGGTITIYGGDVSATGNSEYGAGIGGGKGHGGTVTIFGGTVTAKGYQGDEETGAGIGGASGLEGEGSGGTVTIFGGTVNATGGKNAAGIGGMNSGSGGTFIMHGGNVTANGGYGSAGVGGGIRGAGGNVTIDGGTLTATGNYGAGIGGGAQAAGGTVTITGGTVTATGGEGAVGIGAGYNNSTHGGLTIGEDLTVFGGDSADPKEAIYEYATTRAKYMVVKEAAPRDPVSYISRTWDGSKIVEEEKILTKYKLISNCEGQSTDLTDANGWYVLNNDHSLINFLYIKGNINLVLCDGFTLSLKILVIYDGFTLNVYGQSGGTGTLSVHEPDSYITHAIETRGSSSALNIYGGTVNAIADREGAGISTTGLISIYGGTVNATGSDGWYAAGIGGKYGEAGGTVNIYGGEVRANGGQSSGKYAVGIGAGGTSTSHGTINLASNLRVYGNNTSKDLTALDMKTDYATTRWHYMAVLPAPEYTIPTDLEIEYGHTLADITLPDNWSWVDSTASVGEVGTHQFQATYIPEGYIGILENISVTVGKATPEYTVPTGLEAIVEDDLSDIILPEHWSWKTPTDSAGDVGEHQHVAVYTPEDPNYKTVEDTVTVTVKPAPVVSYNIRTWENGEVKTTTITCDNYHKIKSTTLNLTTGWYVLRNDVTVSNRMTITGEVNIILEDGCTLTPMKGITLEGDNVLNLYGQSADTGKIALQNDNDDYLNSPLGSLRGSDYSGGIFNVYGGTITYNSSNFSGASVIGGGYDKAGCQFTIYGGMIDINSQSASGIGGGTGGDNGSFIMYGGSIKIVNSRGYSTCIGSGDDGNNNSIVINGGTVDATITEAYGTAIGSGEKGNGGTITINGGTVTAKSTSSYAGAIGTGSEGNGGTITINGGTVTATSGASAAAIGGNYKGNFDEVIINGGTVTATGGSNGAGIGGGFESNGGKVTINGGTVTATGGDKAAGIGGGRYGNGGTVIINGGTVTATGGEGAYGIGAGYHYDPLSQGTLTVSDDSQVLGGNSANPTTVITKNGSGDYDRYQYMIVNEAHHYSDDIDTTDFYTCIDSDCDHISQGRKDTQDTYKLINEIANETKYSDDWIDKIQSAREKYNSLGEQYKALVPNYQTLVDAEADLAKYVADNEAADAVDTLINAIGNVEYSQTCKDKIDAARAAYDALTDDQKEFVDNYQILTHAEEVYAHIKGVAEKIDEIGSVTYEETSKDKIDIARAAYNALTNEEKNAFPQDKLNVLLAAEAAYKSLDDNAKADAVKDLIAAIGEVQYPNSKEAIDAARAAYNALTDDQKALVTNYDVLTSAEAAYKTADDKTKSDAVEALINNIGTVEYTEACKDKIDAAREAYDSLTTDQKALVDNYSTLTHAEEVYGHVEEAVNKIEEIGEVTYSGESKEAIDAARAAYDSLSDEEKALMPEVRVNVLVEAETTYDSLTPKVNAFCIVVLVISILLALVAAAYVILRIKPFKLPQKVEEFGNTVTSKEVLLTFIATIALFVNFILDLVALIVHPCACSIIAFILGVLLFGGITYWYVRTRRNSEMTSIEQNAFNKVQKVFKKNKEDNKSDK